MCVAAFSPRRLPQADTLPLQFYEFGNGSVFQVAADANSVTYSPATPVATPLFGSTSTSSSSTGVTTGAANGAVGMRLGPAHFAASLAVIGGLVAGALTVL